MSLPEIIQGGMGVAISDYRLARAVAREDQLGVVSGTGIALILVNRLQQGDPGGDMRRALAAFPEPDVAERALARYFVEGGAPPGQPLKRAPMWTLQPSPALVELTVLASFAEVWLAREGHEGVVGTNLLEKIQLPHLATLYGAMLAGVDAVLIGAGVPTQIPGVLDRLAGHEDAEYRLAVDGAGRDEEHRIGFDPRGVFPGLAERIGPLKRPAFLPIVSSLTLAVTMLRRSSGRVDGLIVEAPSAGGHNAPPRGKLTLDEQGEPVYGPRDEVDWEKVAGLGVPFWIAGGYGRAGGLRDAKALGARGIQVGTLFAFCEESGMAPEICRRVLDRVDRGEIEVHTSAVASPTGFPFKVTQLPGTLSDPGVYAERDRICDIGYLRSLAKDESGKVVYRCSAEPVEDYVRKGGTREEAEDRVCLCNALAAAAGQAQHRKDGYLEPPIVTAGDALSQLRQQLPDDRRSYSVRDVLDVLQA